MNIIELKAIEQQLQYALDELQNEKPNINLLHDWISDPLMRVKKLIIPDVIACSSHKFEKINEHIEECEICGHVDFIN